MAPIAEMSLYANTAVNGRFRASSCLPTGYPMPGVESVPSICTVSSGRSEEHTSELQSHLNLVCRLLLEKKKKRTTVSYHVVDALVHAAVHTALQRFQTHPR